MTGKPAWRFLRPALLVGVPLVAVGTTAAVLLSPNAQPPSLPVPSAAADPAPPSPPPESAIRLAPPPAPTPPPAATAPAPPPPPAATAPAPPPPPAATAPAPPAPPPPPPVPTSPKPTTTAEWMALSIDDLRAFAHAGDLRAMEELARRLIGSVGVPQDSQSGAGWLLRAAEAGSPSAAFNVGVMYERGFVVERDSTKAVEWYRKAADGNVAVAKNNLALLLRDGRGAPRDGNKAIELLRSAALQGTAASMFLLGDIYERGDVVARDAALALAWFAVTAEFERQVNHAPESPLARTAQQRVDILHRSLTPAELERAEKIGQAELQQILAALAPPNAEPSPEPAGPPGARPVAARTRPSPASDDDQAIGWPQATIERVRAVQQVLIDLGRLSGKADGIAGPATRAAIIGLEKRAGLRETGQVSREVYVAALKAILQLDPVVRSPFPPPPPGEPPKTEPSPPPPKTEGSALPARINLGVTEPPPPPPTSADIAKVVAGTAPQEPDPEAWPATRNEQTRAIQALLGELKLMSVTPTGEMGPTTVAAIREYQRMAGLPQTGEPSKALFESLKTTRSLSAPQPLAKPN